jgi:hypothetical protein
MTRIAVVGLILAEAFAGPAAAKDPTDADWMIRMMVCTQENSPNMEVYLPQSIREKAACGGAGASGDRLLHARPQRREQG